LRTIQRHAKPLGLEVLSLAPNRVEWLSLARHLMIWFTMAYNGPAPSNQIFQIHMSIMDEGGGLFCGR
jgi:hypothetical protein